MKYTEENKILFNPLRESLRRAALFSLKKIKLVNLGK